MSVCAAPLQVGTAFVVENMPALFDSVICQLPPFDSQILDPLLELAVQIAREGREGRRIGTLFTIGDSDAVLAKSRPLILDPLAAHPPELRHVRDSKLWGTVKELAQLDGAFIVSGDGTFVAAARHLDTFGGSVQLPFGLGTRHVAAASITATTRAVAIVVSQSSVVRIFCHGELVAEILPEMWLLSREHSIHIEGRTRQVVVRDLAIVTSMFPAGAAPRGE
jgi:diadenylate cyclase